VEWEQENWPASWHPQLESSAMKTECLLPPPPLHADGGRHYAAQTVPRFALHVSGPLPAIIASKSSTHTHPFTQTHKAWDLALRIYAHDVSGNELGC